MKVVIDDCRSDFSAYPEFSADGKNRRVCCWFLPFSVALPKLRN
jgi:hypothetical protein